MATAFIFNKYTLTIVITLFTILLSACSGSVGIRQSLATPEHDLWAQPNLNQNITTRWLEKFNDHQLNAFVNEALTSNYQLAEQTALVAQARHNIIISGADKIPSILFQLNASRSKNIVSKGVSEISENYNVGINVFWELDVWGKLNNYQRKSYLEFKAQQAKLSQLKQQLTANVAVGWYDLLAAKQLTALFKQRLINLTKHLDVINYGYKQGINNALDVYLARSTLEQEQARVFQQQQITMEAKTNLQLLLARNPSNKLKTNQELPVINSSINLGLPSQLLTRKPDLQEAWLRLLAADQSLAVAHKNRFPSFTLTANNGNSSDTLRKLLDNGILGWSLLNSISQPLFKGGKLKALEAQAKSYVMQMEKQYLDQVYKSFAKVENTISRQNSLSNQYQSFLMAEKDSKAALDIADSQYKNGLVTYNMVLEAQRHSFDATSTVLELRNQLLQNRIALYLALGGDFMLQITKEG